MRTAGVEMYDQLARHEIPWTDQSVKDALAEMAKIYGDTDNILGGKAGALQTDNAGSVPPVLSDPPKAAMVIEGDFVPTVAETTLEPVTGTTSSPSVHRRVASPS
jgi:alpha-glucoside transport system substrate-binding protein